MVGKNGSSSKPLIPLATQAGESSKNSSSDDCVSLDSYGLPKYHSHLDAVPRKLTKGFIDVPWELRSSSKISRFSFFSVLLLPQFWNQFDFALRIALIAVLLPSVIIALDKSWNPFISPSMVLSAGVLAAKVTIGESFAYLFTWVRAGLLWLPLACIAGVINLGDSAVGWCFYYTICLFVIALLTENMSRRIGLLLFNICMMGFLLDPTKGGLYPCRVMADWSIGTGLCFFAAFVPFPRFCKHRAQSTLERIAQNTGTAFQGLAHSFWSSTNVERNLAMSKVSSMTQSLDVLLPLFEYHQSLSKTEFIFESTEIREIREIKFNFFERLRVNLSSMVRVLNILQDAPETVDACERAKKFGVVLQPKINDVAVVFDELIVVLGIAKTKEDLNAALPLIELLKIKAAALQQDYADARRRVFYELNSHQLEEFVPLMSFYFFTVASFMDTVAVFEMKFKSYSASPFSSTMRIIRSVTIDCFVDSVHFFKELFRDRNRREWQQVLEAVKVSGAMILTVGFTFLIKTQKEYISGPNIIAFVAGFNTVEAVQASIVRLTGCLLGTVFGFFAGTYSTTTTERVASLCSLMLFGTFLRNDKEYGVMAVYGMFVLIPLDAVNGVGLEEAVARMNQNTFAIFIYLFVIALIFPLSPRRILVKKRQNILTKMNEVLASLMELFSSENLAKGVTLGFQDHKKCALQDVGLELKQSMFLVHERDHALERITGTIEDLKKRVKSTGGIMRYAKDERGIIESFYPSEACNMVFVRMHRMTTLLETMWMSWNVIRSEGFMSKEMQHMMRNLTVVAQDVSRSFCRFTRVMICMLSQPRVNLEKEATKEVLELIQCAHELHTRKSKLMLLVILQCVNQYSDDGVRESPSHDSLKVFPERNISILADVQRLNGLPHSEVRSPVKLPSNFTIPLSSEFTEGMHSLSMSLEMFANETKHLMVELCLITDNARTAL